MNPAWNLTPRERQVMVSMVKHGGVMKIVADELSISVKTVDTLYGRACEKIGGRTRTQSLLNWDRWCRAARGAVEVCSHCAGTGHVYREAA